jgi:hypothetical protein
VRAHEEQVKNNAELDAQHLQLRIEFSIVFHLLFVGAHQIVIARLVNFAAQVDLTETISNLQQSLKLVQDELRLTEPLVAKGAAGPVRLRRRDSYSCLSRVTSCGSFRVSALNCSGVPD